MKKPPPPDPVLTRARNILKKIDQVPAMIDVPTVLRKAHQEQELATKKTDALIVLARARGMTWDAIGGLIDVSKQGANARHKAAVERMGLVNKS